MVRPHQGRRGRRVIFGSDNMAGIAAPVLDAIVRASGGGATSYGDDHWSEQAGRELARVFEAPVEAFFVATGTAANCLALSSLLHPWECVIAHHQGHIATDELTAPELFTGGARVVGIGHGTGRMTGRDLKAALARLPNHPPHNARPAVLSIAQANENGLVYTPDDIAELAGIAHAANMRVHLDGARFANAVASLGCSPADLTWRAGVDVLCLGATKGGALAAEAVIFFGDSHDGAFAHRRKRTGHLVSKGRLFGAQFCGWLGDDAWLDLSRHANAMAKTLSDGLARVPGVRIAWPTQANEVFAILPRTLCDRLHAAGASFAEWGAGALPDDCALPADARYVRFVASFATTPADVDALLAVCAPVFA